MSRSLYANWQFCHYLLVDETSYVTPDANTLTLEQKATLCMGATVWDTAALPHEGIESVALSDGPHGVRYQPVSSAALGLGGSAPATCFPTACALGSSWSPALVYEVGSALGVEAAAYGVAVLLGPGVNIKRSPLGGRNFEYVAEDPCLSGRIGAAWVSGVQSQHVGASLKHFAVNNQETDRLRVDVEVDERTLREIYLPAFEHVVCSARPWTVMCAYNRINGAYASEHRWLLTDVLRGEWEFDGLVVSDWGAVHDRVAALAAGLDLEMPPNAGISDRAVVAAVRDGSLASELLDESVDRVLQLVRRSRRRVPATGLLPRATLAEHHALARRAAAEGMVLLRNTQAVLPLIDRAELGVAVVGPLAIEARYQGVGSSQVNATQVDSPLEELRGALPSARIEHVHGIGDDASVDAAVELACRSDVVVVFLGMSADAEAEGVDRTDMDLPASQVSLLAALAQRASEIPVVAVICQGSAIQMQPWEQSVDAALLCWLGGQAMGSALADVLTGKVDPGGRLSETMPLRLEDAPSYLAFPGGEGRVSYGEGVFVGYRGYDAMGREVAYPFGHGLSYTTFGYSDITVVVHGEADRGDLSVEVAATITNLGDRAGFEVAQLYVGPPSTTAVHRPPRELRGFVKVHLVPRETTRVTFVLSARDLAYWSIVHHSWVVEPGRIDIWVGASSRDLRLHSTAEITATRPRTPLTSTSTLNEWLDDPDGHAALLAAVGCDPDGRPKGLLGDPDLIRLVASVPLCTLALFPGVGFTTDTIRGIKFGAGPVAETSHIG